jgi:prolipoprotein diacylglyceryltransferase
MYPILYGSIASYDAAWLCAAVVCIGGGSMVAQRAGFPLGRSALALALCGVSILIGSKLLYLLETWLGLTGSPLPAGRDGMMSGFRIPGGILALWAVIPVVCSALDLPWRRLGDVLIPMAALALVFIRIGCFLNGCCFGKLSNLPWALAFPPGSWAYWYQQTQGWIAPSAPASLPVHPLQLYFAGAAVMTLAVLLAHQRRHPEPGSTQLLFYLLFFGSTALLEPLREHPLILNTWLCAVGATITGLALLTRARPAQVSRVAADLP